MLNDRVADQSEDEDLRLMALAVLCMVELERQHVAEELCLLSAAKCTQAEAAAFLRIEGWVNQ